MNYLKDLMQTEEIRAIAEKVIGGVEFSIFSVGTEFVLYRDDDKILSHTNYGYVKKYIDGYVDGFVDGELKKKRNEVDKDD